MNRFLLLLIPALYCTSLFTSGQPAYDYSKLNRETLNRGVAAIRKDASTNFVSWRYLSSDPGDIAFDVYRNGMKVNPEPIQTATCFEDRDVPAGEAVYRVCAVNSENIPFSEGSFTLAGDAPIGYLNIPLDVPPPGTTPTGQEYRYIPNDASVGDVDGDGAYEIILKWDPSNARDNAHEGYTGNVYFDCYRLNGEKLWRIDMGRNIRAGAHYTQFMVYDLDGDGRAEIVMKTGDGTIDGQGRVIGDPAADHRSSIEHIGRILTGPEYLTVFDGLTGKALHTVDYIPDRGVGPVWGDEKGNRGERYLAAVAYLDGEHPSVVMCRGYYARTTLAAWDFRDGKLISRWVFDSAVPGNEGYAGQGNHNLRVGDVDGDGRDEIVYGSCTIDHDGTGLYTTRLGHGDALHMTVFDPRRGGMQVWDCHENKREGSTFRDAATGEILFQIPSPTDVGRCMAADIDPNHPGVEMWSSDSHGIRNIKGEVINPNLRSVSVNMAVWWDGDLNRELLDRNVISKYNPESGLSEALLVMEGAQSNNGSKATPAIQGDLIGDWREEVLLRTEDNQNLRLYTTTHDTPYRFHTFVEDPVYRISLATQNVAYNQPSQPGFYFGSDLGKCFPEKELAATGAIVLDAGMDYDWYEWSVGGSDRTRRITAQDIPIGKRTRIELSVGFRGYVFTDYVYVTLSAE